MYYYMFRLQPVAIVRELQYPKTYKKFLSGMSIINGKNKALKSLHY